MVQIPDKLYFKIGEVSRLTRLKPYILRYWESEFKILSPLKSQGRQRVYKKEDLEKILYIKKLIVKDRFTLEGVKKRLKEFKRTDEEQMPLPFHDKKVLNELKDIRQNLASIKNILSGRR